MTGPLPYIGGKNRLAKRLIALLPEHTTYVEPFGGGGQLLFHKSPSAVEVFNDLNYDVVNFFRIVQWHYQELLRCLRYCLISRKMHEWYKNTNPETLTDVQRAARFFLLQKGSWAGLVTKQNFHYGVSHPTNFNPARIPKIIEAAHRRLQKVQIECLPYEEVLRRYDRDSTIFFIDPPYWGLKLYRHNFEPEDFQILGDRLANLKGKFILTLNDRPEVRQTFGRFHLKPIDLAYSAARSNGQRYSELLITNYTVSAARPTNRPKETGVSLSE